MSAPATLEYWQAAALQTADKVEARLLADALRAACVAGTVEHETAERAVPRGVRTIGYIGGRPAGARMAPPAPAVTVLTYRVTAPAFAAWLRAQRLDPAPRGRAWLLASGGTEPAPATAPDEPTPTRTDALSGVLKMARAQAGADDWHSVWAALVQLAQSAKRAPPLLGYVEGEGVKYEAHDGSVKFFKREALRKRLERSEKKP